MTSTAFHTLRVINVAAETADAIVVTLAADDAAAFAFSPGQHLTFRAEIAGEDVRRNYSLCVPPGDPLRVAIKRVEGGRFSSWAATALKPGDTIESMTPRGHFTWAFDSAARRNYVAIAGGSGITPILSLLVAGLAQERGSRFTLLYGNRTSNSVMFLEEIAALKDRYLERLQVYHFLTAEADDIDLFNGRLDADRMAIALDSIIDPALVDAAFICGPGAMMDSAEAALIAAGVNPDHVLVERFTTGLVATNAAFAAEVSSSAAGLKMQITLDGRRRTVAFDATKGSILASAQAAGMPAPYACKAGVCATCRARLTSGQVKMLANYGLSKEEVAQGYILTCQSVPQSADVAIDFDG